MVVARVCIGGSSYTGARSLLRWKVVFMFLYLPPGPGGTAMSEGKTCPDRNWPLSHWYRAGKFDRPGSKSGALSWGCTKCAWRCSVHDSADMGEMSELFFNRHQLVHLWAASVNECNHICIFFFDWSFLSLQYVEYYCCSSAKGWLCFCSIWSVTCTHGKLCHTKGPWEARLYSAWHLSCCHTSGISSMRNDI